MDEESKLSLQLNRVLLMTDLDPDNVVNYLFQEKILNKDDMEQLEAERLKSKRTQILLDKLPGKGPDAFPTFLKALEEAEYSHLVTALRTAQWPQTTRCRHLSGSQIQAMMIEGAVPQRPSIYKERPEIEEVREKLEIISRSPGFVVIHGMAGIGKSVLASESVRDSKVLTLYFPTGVYWISIGQIDLKQDSQMMLVKMQNLLARLDKQGKVSPRNVEEATDRLRTVFAQQYPKSLLILDDIWSSAALAAFDIQCRTMVTTRDAGITFKVRGDVHKVALSQGFTNEQTKEVLAEWTGTDIGELPSEADQIYREVKGSPFAISLIGALLRDHPKRWAYYAGLLAERKVKKFRRAISYQYETLTEAVGISFHSLADETKKYYQDFAVFEGDVKIPAKVLSIFWDEDMETVEDTMISLVNKSMAFQEDAPKGSTSNYVYYLHDLHLDFLKDQCVDQKRLHEKFVEKYKYHCNGQYHDLVDDGYIFWYLGDHLSKAGMFEEMGKIYFDLRFVAAKISATGLSFVLGDYTQNSRTLNVLDQQKQTDFSKFLAHLSVERERDIIQCGLLQPQKSGVFIQAQFLQNNSNEQLDKYLKTCPSKNSVDTLSINERLYMCDASDLELISNIGRSSTSIVNKVRHKPSGTIMALKKLSVGSDYQVQKRVLKQLDVSMRSASCPHTVHFYGALFHEGDVQICMELMDTSLEKLYKKAAEMKRSIPENFLCKVASDIIDALHYLQSELSVVHRDVKPANILLNKEGMIKLCDFGISSQLQDSISKTLDKGCKPYMAPERINPTVLMRYYDERSDIWSLGITLIETASGQHPYANYANVHKQLTAIVDGDPPTLPTGEFSSDFEDFIGCCLQKNYKNRPKYNTLKQHTFITKRSKEDTGFVKSILQD